MRARATVASGTSCMSGVYAPTALMCTPGLSQASSKTARRDVVAVQMMSAPTSSGAEASSQSAQLNQSMQLTMPLMFGVITVNLASGLALYFVISNVVGIVMQYFTTGLGGLATLLPQRTATALGAPTASEQKGTRSGSRKKKR